MSELDGNVNINDVLQVVRFGGESLNFAIKGVKGIGKGIINTGKLAKKGYNKTSLMRMQMKLFFHFHSKAISGEGELKKGMSLHSMEKLTGGDYSIVNLPTEDDKILAKFFSNLKKAKIAYAVMPDLIPNNGFSQIAIDPTTAHRLESIMDVFDFKNGKTVKESVPEEEKGKIIPFEEYWDEGNPEEKEKIIQSAVAEAEREQREKTKVVSMEEFVKGKNEQEIKKNLESPLKSVEKTKEDVKNMMKIEKIRERHQSKDYYPITIDRTMIVAENEKAYVTRVPGSYDQESGNFLLMTVNKDNTLKTNNGQTLLTHMRKDGKTYICNQNKENGVMMKNQQLYREHYSEYSTDFDLKKKKNHARTKNMKNQNVNTIHVPRNLKK